MKHNEVKAFFKKVLSNTLQDYHVLSIDETQSSRIIYVADKNLKVSHIIYTWFGTNEYSIKVVKNRDEKVNCFTKPEIEVKGSYQQLHLINKVLSGLGKCLKN